VRALAVVAVVASLVGAAPAHSAGAQDGGTERPFPAPAGACYTASGPTAMAPNQMAALYGLDRLWAAGARGQGHSIAILGPDATPDVAEVQAFRHCFGVDVPLTTLNIGPGAEPQVSGEATLDVTTSMSAAPGLDHVYQFGGRAGLVNPLLELLRAALDPANTGGQLVDAVSTSFSMCEPRAVAGHHSYDAQYLPEMTALLEHAASLGVTVFADAGDSGSSNCAAHPVHENEPDVALAAVGFPGSSPYAVSVGGSQFELRKDVDGSGRVTTERVWNEPDATQPGTRMAGSGGVSTLFTAPSWQEGLVPAGMRSVPDVTALAGTPGYSWSDDHSVWFGTSAATPFTAASWLVALSALDARGIASPGFFGQVLYDLARRQRADPAAPAVLRDITVGDNDVWGKVGCCVAGPGFDRASGLGSLRWDQVVEALAPTPPSTTTTVPVAVPAPPAAAPLRLVG
jgi:kumamolisin